MDSDGRRGGLMILWRGPFDVNIQSYSKGHIDCIVKHEGRNWRFTWF